MVSIASDKAGIADFNITVGNDFSKTIELYDDDDGTALEMPGATITTKIRRNRYDTAEADVSGFTVVSDIANGSFSINLTAAQTITLGPKDYWYAIEIEYSGSAFTYLAGILHLRYEATR